MPRNYTVVFSHPSGASATFIYENGELSSLAKGLDAEQFWVFKQVKAHLLRNEEDDIARATKMMADQGFTAQIMQPLPDLLAPIQEARAPVAVEEEEPAIRYRRPPGVGDFSHPAQTVSEIHWREADVKPTLPPHRQPPVSVPAGAHAAEADETVKEWQPTDGPAQTVSEIHWREGDTEPSQP
jgi:hypothetical protein